MKVRQAIVMVGGKGTRLLPLTENRPKPILPVADRPCIWYLLRSLARAGIEEVILACGYKPGAMEILGDGSDLGIRIIYSYEDEPLGTAGAMKLAESRLDDVFVAANGDVFADIDVKAEIEKHLSTEADITIALTPVENPCEFGIARVDDELRITEFKEKPREEEVFSNLINAGVYVLNKDVLSRVPESSFFDFSKDLVPVIMGEGGRIQGYQLDGIWMDVGRPHDLLGANLSVADHEMKGWSDEQKESNRVSGPFYVGPGSSVRDSECRSTVVLHGSKVTGSKLQNVLVMKNCVVEEADLRNTILGEGCIVRKGARITDAVLADGMVVRKGEEIHGGRTVRSLLGALLLGAGPLLLDGDPVGVLVALDGLLP